MPMIYNFTPASYYFFNNTTPVVSNLQVNLTPSSYTGSGTIWENTQNSTEATLVNTPSYNAFTGFGFNGSTQYATLSSVSGITDFTSSQNYTVEVWCNIASTQNDTARADNCIIEKWNSSNEGAYPYVMRFIRGSNNVNIACYNGTINPTISIPTTTNTWNQIVGVFDHSNDLLYGYKNGSIAATGAMAITGVNNTSTLNIARRANNVGGGTNYFTGNVAIVRIYSTALTSSQILQNYNANKTQFGLV